MLQWRDREAIGQSLAAHKTEIAWKAAENDWRRWNDFEAF